MLGLITCPFYAETALQYRGIFGIGLANAIFVDEMPMDNDRDLNRKVWMRSPRRYVPCAAASKPSRRPAIAAS